MSFITGTHLARRTFLRGMGATVALPFLDAMVPAGRIFAKAPAAERTRLLCIEEVHGLAGCSRRSRSVPTSSSSPTTRCRHSRATANT
jgi:hypothetical protein